MKVLVVNGEAIEEAAIRREAAAILQLLKERMTGEDEWELRLRARQWAEENQIEAVLLRQAATGEPVEQLVARVTSDVPRPRRKDVADYYAKNREAFREPEQIRAAHIVKNVDEHNSEDSARAAIEKARDELAKGRPFGEVADEMSDCPGKGGDLGRFGRGEMVAAFENVVFGLGVNEVSAIFRTEFGFHIAKLLERTPEGIRTLNQATPAIEAHLMAEKKQDKLHEYLDQLRSRAEIRREERPAV